MRLNCGTESVHLAVQSVNINFVRSDIYHQMDSHRCEKVVENVDQIVSACEMFP